MKDYYTILGVQRQSSEEEIKAAFKQLAKIHHPDVAEDKGTSAIKFAEINEAYETLGDSQKRKDYDNAQSKALVTDLDASAKQVVDEYFQQFHNKP